jgi:hypothetical protein
MMIIKTRAFWRARKCMQAIDVFKNGFDDPKEFSVTIVLCKRCENRFSSIYAKLS